MRLRLMFGLLLVVLGMCARFTAFAQSDPIERTWYNDDRTAKIQIYKAEDGKFQGKIVWLKIPERNGKPKVDERNPDPDKRARPILGLVILEGFEKDGENGYEEGTIYDPKSGKTYSCKMTRNGNELDVRGYIGFSMFGRSTTLYCE